MLTTNQVWDESMKWEGVLAASGFTRGKDNERFARKEVDFRMEGTWSVLGNRSTPEGADPLVGQMGKPGFWKFVDNGEKLQSVFELPPLEFDDGGADSTWNELPASSHWGSMLNWALDTQDGRIPKGWRPPPREEIDVLVPREKLTVPCGIHPRQGELIHEGDRLAVRVLIVQHVSEDWAEDRQYWFHKLLLEAQSRWRLVRFGYSDRLPLGAVCAEVDLTGAPSDALPELLRIVLVALKAAVEWIMSSIMYLINAPDECRALQLREPARSRESKRERR